MCLFVVYILWFKIIMLGVFEWELELYIFILYEWLSSIVIVIMNFLIIWILFVMIFGVGYLNVFLLFLVVKVNCWRSLNGLVWWVVIVLRFDFFLIGVYIFFILLKFWNFLFRLKMLVIMWCFWILMKVLRKLDFFILLNILFFGM